MYIRAAKGPQRDHVMCTCLCQSRISPPDDVAISCASGLTAQADTMVLCAYNAEKKTADHLIGEQCGRTGMGPKLFCAETRRTRETQLALKSKQYRLVPGRNVKFPLQSFSRRFL